MRFYVDLCILIISGNTTDTAGSAVAQYRGFDPHEL